MVYWDSSSESFNVSDQWIGILGTLLFTTFGAYFGVRGVEKIMKKLKK
jgi:hypothetical protein